MYSGERDLFGCARFRYKIYPTPDAALDAFAAVVDGFSVKHRAQVEDPTLLSYVFVESYKRPSECLVWIGRFPSESAVSICEEDTPNYTRYDGMWDSHQLCYDGDDMDDDDDEDNKPSYYVDWDAQFRTSAPAQGRESQYPDDAEQ